MNDAKKILLSEIVIESTFRVRVREDQDVIDDYAEVFEQYMLKESDDVVYPFPPIHVWCRSKGEYILIAGFHRFQAARQVGMETIIAIEFTGDEDAAFEFALSDNSRNGQRLSRDDLRVCIEKTLSRYPDKSLTIISNMTGVSRTRCHEIKKEMERLPVNENLFPNKVMGKDGRIQSATKSRVRKQKPTPILEEPELAPTSVRVLSTLPEPVVPTMSQAEDDELDIIRWDRLEGISARDQIARYCYALDLFEEKLKDNKKEKSILYKKVYRWVIRRYNPSSNATAS